jgi:hypothetical protein
MQSWKPEEFVKWLKEKDLFHMIRVNYDKLMPILLSNLKLTKRDDFLIICDTGFPNKRCAPLLAGCYLLCAKRLGINVRMVVQKPKKEGDYAEDLLIQSIKNLLEDNVIALCLSQKLGSFHEMGTTFKKIAHVKRYKFVSTYYLHELPTEKFKFLLNALSIDYVSLQKKAQEIKKKLDIGRRIDIITDSGTQLKASIEGMIAYCNDAREITAHGNVPVGEVYIAPKKNLVSGVVVIDGSIKTNQETIIVNKPVKIIIENGEIKDILGSGDESKKLKKCLDYYMSFKNNKNVKRIGEIGIGLNPGATICGPTIINEKSLGTAHVAIGNNKSFGGTIYAPNHLDQVFRNPRIYVDGSLLRINK